MNAPQVASTEQSSPVLDSRGSSVGLVDRLSRFVEGLPGPSWAWYLLAWSILFGVETWLKWRDGAYPVGQFSLFHAWYTGSLVYPFAVLHYIRRSAAERLGALKPYLVVRADQYAGLQRDLTTCPLGPELAAGLVTAAGGWLYYSAVLVHQPAVQLATSPAAAVYDGFVYMVAFWVLGPVVYRAFRLLRAVNVIYRDYIRINLFELGPLYTLSGLEAQLGLAWLFALYLWVAISPDTAGSRIGWFVTFAQGVLSVVSLVLPLLGAHRRLELEKSQLEVEIGRRVQNLIHESHRRLDAGELANMTEIKNSLDSLQGEKAYVDKISTWPWDPNAVRLVLTALFLPLLIWLVQRLLDRVLA